ncbi:MAG: DoxX family protein [Kofleriaceae bacterium]|nr:DoxX family protein [Kofleriaceae bacterium]
MHIVLWIVQGIVALAFVGAALSKLTQPRSQLLENKWMAWANDFTEGQIKLIGLAELAGAAGLILPMALGIMPDLTRAAAGGLGLLMAGAVVTHVKRREPAAPPALLGLLAIAIAIGRSI